MTKDELQAEVGRLEWYHKVALPHGIVTPGWAPVQPEHYCLPADFTGKHVLDVGCYDGYWGFEALRRGATDLLAIDDFSDTIHENEKRSWAQWDLCAQALQFNAFVQRKKWSVYEVSQLACEGTFDVILFFGVLYHCRHPLLALDRLRSVCAPGAMLCVETAICDDYSPYGRGHGNDMVMEFYAGSELGGYAKNWWAPTLTCLGAILEAAGFVNVVKWKVQDPDDPSECRGFARAFMP